MQAIERSYKESDYLTKETENFYEMCKNDGFLIAILSDKKIIKKIIKDNVFQYLSEQSVKRPLVVCVNRLYMKENELFLGIVAENDFITTKQICLHVIMKLYWLGWNFLLTVIEAKYRYLDTTFFKTYLNNCVLCLQELNDCVETLDDRTVNKIITTVYEDPCGKRVFGIFDCGLPNYGTDQSTAEESPSGIVAGICTFSL